MNDCKFMGRLTKDPETAYTQSQKMVTKFSIAVNHRFKKDETDYFNVVTWGKTAEFAEKWLYKGQLIVVAGEIHNRTWEKDGRKITITEITANEIYPCEWKQKEEKVEQEKVEEEFIDDDGLPF